MARLHRKPRPIAMQLGDSELLKTGTSRYDWRDPYTMAITIRWPLFFVGLLCIYILINSVFALLYMMFPGCIAQANPLTVTDAFFFSVETLATVGYGSMAPATLAGHIISSLELVCGLVFTAVITGLIFVRFSRSNTNIIFADNAVISQHDGKPTLMVRLANGRESVIANATAKLTVLVRRTSAEGRSYRHAYELKLERAHMPLFLLTWTLMHTIDDHSPFHNLSPDQAADQKLMLILVIDAHDHSLGKHIFDFHSYASDHILFGMAYKDVISFDDLGRTHADLGKLGAVEPDFNSNALQEGGQGADLGNT